MLVAACVQTADFGRAAPTAWNALVDRTGTISAFVRDEPLAPFAYTDDEGELRDRAWRFLMPGEARSAFDRLLANLARARVLPASWRPSDPANYFDALADGPARSPVSRFRRLSEDMVADGRLIPAFAALASRVVAADGLRLRSLPYVEGLEPDEVRQAAMRVAENRCLIAWVRHESGARARAYRHALQHLFVETPVAEAVAAERSLGFLDARRGALDGLLPPGVGARCGIAEPPVEPAILTVKD